MTSQIRAIKKQHFKKTTVSRSRRLDNLEQTEHQKHNQWQATFPTAGCKFTTGQSGEAFTIYFIKSLEAIKWKLSSSPSNNSLESWIFALTAATQLHLACKSWLENLTVHFSSSLPLTRFRWLFPWHLKTQVCLKPRPVYLIFFIRKITQNHTAGFFFFRLMLPQKCLFIAFILYFWSLNYQILRDQRRKLKSRAKRIWTSLFCKTNSGVFWLARYCNFIKDIGPLTTHWRKPGGTQPSSCSSSPNLESTWWLRMTHKMCHEVE